MKKLTLAGIAIMVVLLSPGFAQADSGNNNLWETYPPGPLTGAAVETEVIDEIVVVGQHFEFDQLRGPAEQVGLIEVFRIRFGHLGT